MCLSLPKRLPGRPRSDAARKAVLEAANCLLEEAGYSGLSMEGIAAKAKVGKATLYRWWPSKGAVAMEAFLAATAPRIAFGRTESAVADVTSQMLKLAQVYRGVTGKLICELIALGQSDPDTLESFQNGYLGPRRAAAKEVLERGVLNGEIRPDADLNILVDALYGPIFHRMLVRHLPLEDEFVLNLARLVFAGAAPRP